jgi:hypothetical protein
MRRVNDSAGNAALSVLEGGHLDTVSFVMDYVEFRIGYNCFRALRPPRVCLRDGQIAQFPQEGSRDALCRLIDTTVVSAVEIHGADGQERIEIRTDAGDVLSVDIGGYDIAEFAHLVPADSQGRLIVSKMAIW